MKHFPERHIAAHCLLRLPDRFDKRLDLDAVLSAGKDDIGPVLDTELLQFCRKHDPTRRHLSPDDLRRKPIFIII
jgi:hypothetical protein